MIGAAIRPVIVAGFLASFLAGFLAMILPVVERMMVIVAARLALTSVMAVVVTIVVVVGLIRLRVIMLCLGPVGHQRSHAGFPTLAGVYDRPI